MDWEHGFASDEISMASDSNNVSKILAFGTYRTTRDMCMGLLHELYAFSSR